MTTDPLAALNPPWTCNRLSMMKRDHFIVKDSKGQHVGSVLPLESESVTEARARLMAAAPELAARLRRFVDGFRAARVAEGGAHEMECGWCYRHGCTPECDVTQAENLLALLGLETKP